MDLVTFNCPGSVLLMFCATTPSFLPNPLYFWYHPQFICLKFLGSFQAKGNLSLPPKYTCLWGLKMLIKSGLPVTLKYFEILVSVSISEMMEGMNVSKF